MTRNVRRVVRRATHVVEIGESYGKMESRSEYPLT